MKKFLLLPLALLAFPYLAVAEKKLPALDATNSFANPILTGMNPDPSICRVGEDYYLVTSSFGFFPGLPIYHSKDLINWRLIGHGINRPSQLKLKGNERLNLFAATIRYHQGVFYLINTSTGTGGADRNFVITATDPAGPWSDAHWIADAPKIDPSLFFDDDGKVYYIGNTVPQNPLFEKARDIWMQEIDPKTWKLVGEKVDAVQTSDYVRELDLKGKQTDLLNNFEGPHLYKKDGAYYILLSHGGTGWGHAVGIWKSDKVFGPYVAHKGNPLVTHRDLSHTHALHHTGHADLVQTQNNEWWMVLLASRPYGGDYTNLGRETCLVPVDWSGTWPVVNPEGPVGRMLERHRRPNLPAHPWPAQNPRDEFTGDKLGLDCNFIQTPTTTWWSLNQPAGQLKINLRPEIIAERKNPSFIGRRMAHKRFTATTKMEFSPRTPNEAAGLVITRDVSNHFQMLCRLDGDKAIVELKRQDGVAKTKSVVAQKPVSGKTLYLKVDADEQLFTFSYSENGTDWKILAEREDARLLSTALDIGRFTGTFVGMYATANGEKSDNSALFDWFEYRGRE